MTQEGLTSRGPLQKKPLGSWQSKEAVPLTVAMSFRRKSAISMMDSDDETERIIQGPMRGAVHEHLLRNGYINERTTVDARGALVVVTAAGRKALRNRS